jgi:hypothetical protein
VGGGKEKRKGGAHGKKVFQTLVHDAQPQVAVEGASEWPRGRKKGIELVGV